MRRTCLTAILLATTFAAPAAQAADARGAYAVHEAAGLRSCADALRARLDGAAPAALSAWVQGVLTGINMALPNTFDIAPFRGDPALPDLVMRRCEASPEAPLHAVLFQVVNALVPLRLEQAAPTVAMTVGGRTVLLAEPTVRQVQQALIQRGFLRQQRLDGQYTAAVRAALAAFQEAERLPVTGLPDPETLLRLSGR